MVTATATAAAAATAMGLGAVSALERAVATGGQAEPALAMELVRASDLGLHQVLRCLGGGREDKTPWLVRFVTVKQLCQHANSASKTKAPYLSTREPPLCTRAARDAKRPAAERAS